MNDHLTEREAAERIGWTPANLRSHRERAALSTLAEQLGDDVLAVVRALAGRDRPSLPDLLDVSQEPLRLTRMDDQGRQRLNSRGLEVARWLRHGPRTETPPRWVETTAGIRYRSEDLDDWLDRHPASAEREDLLTEADVLRITGLSRTTIKTLRYRARRAQEELAQMPTGERRRRGETLEQHRQRLARVKALRAVVDGLPPGLRVGRQYRYRREDVDAWLARHPGRNEPHPLARPRDRSRGRLLQPHVVARRMRIQPQSLVGYRCRAGAAARRLRDGNPRPGDEALATSVPPHVIHEGRVRYQEHDVREWIQRRKPARRSKR